MLSALDPAPLTRKSDSTGSKTVNIAKKPLARAQKIIKTVIPARPLRPVLGAVLFCNGYAYATDLEHTVKVALAPGAQVESPFLVPWSAFKALRGDAEISPVLTDPKKPRVRIGGVLLDSFDADEYPPISDVFPPRMQPVNMEHLLPHLRRADVTRAHGETARALLTGVGVFDDGAIIATDGFHAYWSDPEPCYEGRVLASAAGGHGVLPGVTYGILAAFGWDHASAGAETKTRPETSYAGGTKTDIQVHSTRWCFACDGEAAWLRGVEGKYFAVRDLVPKTFPHTIAFDRLEVLQTLKQAASVVREKPHTVTLQVNGDDMRVYAKQHGGEFDGDVRILEATGMLTEISFDVQRLIASLTHIMEGMGAVTLEISGDDTLARMKVTGGVYGIMPQDNPDKIPCR